MHANDLLDQRIIEQGNFMPLYTESSVAKAIIEVIELFRHTLSKRKLDIDCDQDSLYGLPHMRFDKRRLQ